MYTMQHPPRHAIYRWAWTVAAGREGGSPWALHESTALIGFSTCVRLFRSRLDSVTFITYLLTYLQTFTSYSKFSSLRNRELEIETLIFAPMPLSYIEID